MLTRIATLLATAGLLVLPVLSASSAASAASTTHRQDVRCALSVTVGHNAAQTSATNHNGNPCGRFYWAWGIFLIGGQQSQHDSRGVQSGTTTVTPLGATKNCGGGWKWSDSTGIVHQHQTYGSVSCAGIKVTKVVVLTPARNWYTLAA